MAKYSDIFGLVRLYVIRKKIAHMTLRFEGKDRIFWSHDTIVADCEGCLLGEYEKNPDLFANVSTVQVERDDGGTYDDLFVNKLHLTMVDAGKGLGCDGACDTQVWKRL